MFRFPFQVHEDRSVTIGGLAAGKVTEISGAGHKWRLWHSGGHGFMNGRDWQYGAASHWIVQTEEGVMNTWIDFELGRDWREGRKILSSVVDRLNAEPDADHMAFVRGLEKVVRDWDYQMRDLKPIDRLRRALELT